MRNVSLPRIALPQTATGQILLCVCVSSIFLLPHLAHVGLNGVTRTYLVAAHRFWSGTTPYDAPVPFTDWFRYSPAFAMLYGILAWLPGWLHAISWGALNYTIYWIGVVRWVPAFRDGRIVWFWLVAASMELDGSIRYQQVNALLTGMMLISIAAFRDSRYGRAGGWIATATAWKVFSAPFLLGLCRRQPAYWIGGFVATLVLLVAPAFVVGWNTNWDWHVQWLGMLRQDGAVGRLLDLESVLRAAGLPQSGAYWTRIAVGVATLGFLCDPRRRALFRVAEPLWVCVGLTGILLFNPRTEPPTYVLAAPALPMLWIASRAVAGWEKKYVRIALFACFFFLSLVHNDIWPKALWNTRAWNNVDKTYAVFGMWWLSIYLAMRKPS